jgi:hypothetical protein
MPGRSEPLIAWLKRQRRTIDLQESFMAWKFDIDGALSSDQPELAWFARERMIIAAVELFAHLNSLPAPISDPDERAGACVRLLRQVNPAAAAAVSELLLRPMPAEIASDITGSLRMVDEQLHVGVSATRDEMVRDWATSIKLLRDIAAGLGLAGTDEWYLLDSEGPGAGLGWYDQVLAVIS